MPHAAHRDLPADSPAASLRTPPSAPRRRGFTIVEVLVVVAIVLVLVAILVPSLAKSREVGRRATAAANIRSLIQWTLNTAADNDGDLPNLTYGAEHPNWLRLESPDGTEPKAWGNRTRVLTRDQVMSKLEMPREFFYSPNNPGLGLIDELWDGTLATNSDSDRFAVIGYCYWGGNPLIAAGQSANVTWEGTLGPGRLATPMHMEKVSQHKVVWTDLSVKIGGNWVYQQGANSVNNFSGVVDRPILGANVGTIDTAVEFVERDEVKKRVTVSGNFPVIGSVPFEYYW